MPEIGEVARVVHFIRKHLVNKTLTKVTANTDDIVYGKVGTSAAEFEKHMKGKTVVDAGQQGKYFWMIMSSPPHPVMHLGMNGWVKFQSEHTYYYGNRDREAGQEWPPKHVKFLVEAKGNGDTQEAAFVDGRRLGRIRLVHCDGNEIRNNTPLKENGPDPVIDKELVTLEWLTEKCRKKRVPIKAMLLDQAVISGIGNWVADEVMYQSKTHPEQYANTLTDAQIKRIYDSIHYVCDLATSVLADSTKFPEDWLFKHRWGKGKKTGTKTLPNGNQIVFMTVGGRTSAVVPAVQKKTGPVAGDLDENATTAEAAEEELKPVKPKKVSGRKRKAEESEESEESEEEETEDDEDGEAPVRKPAAKKGKPNGTEAKKSSGSVKTPLKAGKGTAKSGDETPGKASSRGKKASVIKSETAQGETPSKKGKIAANKSTPAKAAASPKQEEDSGRRRSGRLRKL